MSKILAGYILAVAAAHEAAFDTVGSESAMDAADEKTKATGVFQRTDFAQFQTKSIYDCAVECVPKLYRQPVYLLLQTAWNDALDWAKEAMQARDADGDDTHDFCLVIEAQNGPVPYQISAQTELAAAFKLGQIFNEDLSIETVRLDAPDVQPLVMVKA